jgi:hypothetical protein
VEAGVDNGVASTFGDAGDSFALLGAGTLSPCVFGGARLVVSEVSSGLEASCLLALFMEANISSRS